MILFQLRCARDHQFEAWFKDSATFDRQARKRQVTCPVCGNDKVTKAPMAPHVSTRKAVAPAGAREGGSGDDAPSAVDPAQDAARQVMEALGRVRKHVEENFEHVGDRFAEEARAIHYGEAERRDIYGDATDKEARDLNEEGITVRRIPWPKRDA
ncbi:MAG: DUF1178 family protein [Rhodobacterales bacterium]|nr:DUF1178 family protein [Rhodobacterales bacterium]